MTDDHRFAGYLAAIESLRPHLRFPETRQVLEHWASLWDTTNPDVPDRQNLDPIAMISALPHLYVMEIEPPSNRLRYRLAGEQVNARYDHGIIGKYLDEITPPDSIERVDSYFRACATRPAAVLLSGTLFAERETPGYGERLLLPIQDIRAQTVGLVGITYQVSLFPEGIGAETQAERLFRIVPFDGRPVETTKSPDR